MHVVMWTWVLGTVSPGARLFRDQMTNPARKIHFKLPAQPAKQSRRACLSRLKSGLLLPDLVGDGGRSPRAQSCSRFFIFRTPCVASSCRDVPCHCLDEQLPQRRVQRRRRARPWLGVRNACLRHRLRQLWPARFHAIAASTVTSSACTQPTAKHVLESMHRSLPQPGWQLHHRLVRHLPRSCMHSRRL